MRNPPARPARLRAIRQALGLSQAELSRRSGISQPILSRVERGEIRSWPKLRRDASIAFRVPEDLLFDVGESTTGRGDG